MEKFARHDFLHQRAYAVFDGFGFRDDALYGVAVGEADAGAGGVDDELAGDVAGEASSFFSSRAR